MFKEACTKKTGSYCFSYWFRKLCTPVPKIRAHQHWVHFRQGRAPSTLQQHRQPRVAVSSSPSWCASPARALQAGNKIQGCCTGAWVCWQWLKKELKKKPKNLKIWGETFSNTQHNRYRINEVSVFFFLKSLSVRLPSSYPKERVFH